MEGSFALEEELERIVALDAVPVLESVEVEEEKVIIRGSMNIDLLYQPTDSWGGVALVAKKVAKLSSFRTRTGSKRCKIRDDSKCPLGC